MRPAIHHTFSNHHLRVPAPMLTTKSRVIGSTPERTECPHVIPTIGTTARTIPIHSGFTLLTGHHIHPKCNAPGITPPNTHIGTLRIGIQPFTHRKCHRSTGKTVSRNGWSFTQITREGTRPSIERISHAVLNTSTRKGRGRRAFFKLGSPEEHGCGTIARVADFSTVGGTHMETHLISCS